MKCTTGGRGYGGVRFMCSLYGGIFGLRCTHKKLIKKKKKKEERYKRKKKKRMLVGGEEINNKY